MYRKDTWVNAQTTIKPDSTTPYVLEGIKQARQVPWVSDAACKINLFYKTIRFQ